MFSGVVVAAFLIGHAAVHGGFVSPRPPQKPGSPAWPFDLEHSWVLAPLGVSPNVARVVGTVLFAATCVAFTVAGLIAIGFLPSQLWTAAVGVGALTSLALLVLFFHRWLIIGVVIDLALLWAVLIAGWTPTS